MSPIDLVGLRRIAALTFGLLVALGASTFYWGFVRAGELAARPDNPRRIESEARVARGRILDRLGAVLAETVRDEDGRPHRAYPVKAAAPVVGFQTWRYGAGEAGRVYGAGGAEAAYDAALNGTLGLGYRDLVATDVLHRPRRGRDVRLTLDAQLQAYVAGLLGQREGAVVVVGVPSGAVLALVSLPTFDPEALDAGTLAVDDPTRPMFNRATQGLYPPGSTWKTVTLAAALAEGLTGLDTVVSDGDATETFGGFPVACANNPENVVTFDVAHAFAWSCNLTFARLGGELGEARYRRHAADFGVGEAPPFALPVVAGSLTSHAEMGLPELASAAFGQGELGVTPLHMALIAAAIAGGGLVPGPYLLAEVEGGAGPLAEGPHEWRPGVDRRTANAVREAMLISARDGWAHSAVAAAGVSAGGKTGTAQVADGAPHSWFIGFAPAEQPRVAVAVLVVHGGEGASVAAPIGGMVLGEALRLDAGG